jgi:predicted RNA-binding protein with PIN domain
MSKSSREEAYIIDGYNVIHKIPDIKELMESDLQSAREKFVFLLDNYFSTKKIQVYVVYDGCNDITTFNIHSTPRIRVLFSKRNQKADILIKILADERKNKALTTIVSSDHEVFQYGKVSRCNVMKSEDFIKKIKAKSFDYENTIKSRTLSKDEIDLWKQLFNKKGV